MCRICILHWVHSSEQSTDQSVFSRVSRTLAIDSWLRRISGTVNRLVLSSLIRRMIFKTSTTMFFIILNFHFTQFWVNISDLTDRYDHGKHDFKSFSQNSFRILIVQYWYLSSMLESSKWMSEMFQVNKASSKPTSHHKWYCRSCLVAWTLPSVADWVY